MMNRYTQLSLIAICLMHINRESQASEYQRTAPPVPPAAKCAFGAFVLESDPAGLNVRQTPSLSGKILGKLPPVIESSELDGFKVKIELDILGSKNGWFLVANAKENTALTGRPARLVFAGSGWVSGSKLTVKSQANKGYARADIKSPIVFSLSDGASFDSDELVHAGQLISCQGNWALFEFSTEKLSADMMKSVVSAPAAQTGLQKGRVRAWLNQICAMQETSCDGTAAQK